MPKGASAISLTDSTAKNYTFLTSYQHQIHNEDFFHFAYDKEQ